MNSTNYVIELLISGITTFIWMLLSGLSLWGYDINILLFEGDRILFTVLLLPIIYIMGIIGDRMTDELFDFIFPLDNLWKGKIPRREALSIVYVKSDTLTKLYEYGRMRIRICRNWSVNGLLILIAGLFYIWSSSIIESEKIRIELTILSIVFLGSSIIASYFAWKKLNKKEFAFLELQSELLKDKK